MQKVQRTGSEGRRALRKGPPLRPPPYPTSVLHPLSPSSVPARLPPAGPRSDPRAVPPPRWRAGAAAPVESRGDAGVTGGHVCFLFKSSSSYMSSSDR
ncbi:uncharacterized protein LOC129542211 isoform X3 [Moschus berezovskii]|uniref:uncharacterized protein LOC129542211 isoform X3 n=1 Tax=Moschus berezovskii TaxID=68408 RepID=UPI00244386AB|nr:uncharacterized protein LOC129542211 isoform X3 [Moschus berezovskii]